MTRRTAAAKAADALAAELQESKSVVAETSPTSVVQKEVKEEDATTQIVPASDKDVSQKTATAHPLVQFPLVTILSFATWSFGHAVLGQVTQGDLAVVTRSQDTWGEVGLLVGWRIVELAVGWFGGFDSWDIAMVDLLSHGPSLYLLMTFYNLNPWTAGSALLVDVLSSALPFYLLRPLSAVHTAGVATLPGRELVDIGLQVYTAAFSTAVYTVSVLLSLRFLLPRVFVLYFAGIPSVEPAYAASYATILPVMLVFGAAASTFIFAPYVTAPTGSKEDLKLAEFDPAKATLGQTLEWNVWGFTVKTKIVMQRTAFTMVITAVNTYLSLTLNIYGVEPNGAIAYAAVWVFAALCTGLGLKFVGAE